MLQELIIDYFQLVWGNKLEKTLLAVTWILHRASWEYAPLQNNQGTILDQITINSGHNSHMQMNHDLYPRDEQLSMEQKHPQFLCQPGNIGSSLSLVNHLTLNQWICTSPLFSPKTIGDLQPAMPLYPDVKVAHPGSGCIHGQLKGDEKFFPNLQDDVRVAHPGYGCIHDQLKGDDKFFPNLQVCFYFLWKPEEFVKPNHSVNDQCPRR